MKPIRIASQPIFFSINAACSTAASSSGSITSPAAPMRSGTSRRRLRAISEWNSPKRPKSCGLSRRPNSMMSRKPRVVIIPQTAPVRSSVAFVPTVVPCTSQEIRGNSTSMARRPLMNPSAWFCGVDGTFDNLTSPVTSSMAMVSVNVPPTSTPT